jgi:hypothetical protein
MSVLDKKKSPCARWNETMANKGRPNENVSQIFDTMNVTRSQRTASSAASAKKSAPAKSAHNIATGKSKSQKKLIGQPSNEQVALRAYFIGERRRALGIQGDETSDWVAAERELLEELKAK